METTREQEIICIMCPMGCRGVVVVNEKDEVIDEKDYQCKKGREYVQAEFKAPLRVLTTTVVTEGAFQPLLPVRTNKPIPKDKRKDCMKVLANIRVKPPIRTGRIIVPNIQNTGADIIATADLANLTS